MDFGTESRLTKMTNNKVQRRFIMSKKLRILLVVLLVFFCVGNTIEAKKKGENIKRRKNHTEKISEATGVELSGISPGEERTFGIVPFHKEDSLYVRLTPAEGHSFDTKQTHTLQNGGRVWEHDKKEWKAYNKSKRIRFASKEIYVNYKEKTYKPVFIGDFIKEKNPIKIKTDWNVTGTFQRNSGLEIEMHPNRPARGRNIKPRGKAKILDLGIGEYGEIRVKFPKGEEGRINSIHCLEDDSFFNEDFSLNNNKRVFFAKAEGTYTIEAIATLDNGTELKNKVQIRVLKPKLIFTLKNTAESNPYYTVIACNVFAEPSLVNFGNILIKEVVITPTKKRITIADTSETKEITTNYDEITGCFTYLADPNYSQYSDLLIYKKNGSSEKIQIVYSKGKNRGSSIFIYKNGIGAVSTNNGKYPDQGGTLQGNIRWTGTIKEEDNRKNNLNFSFQEELPHGCAITITPKGKSGKKINTYVRYNTATGMKSYTYH